MSTVYVLNKDGKPLMPTTRCGHVRHLLKEQKARVVTSKPFTILRLCGWITPIFRNGNIGRVHSIKKQALKKLSPKCKNIIACFARSPLHITIM